MKINYSVFFFAVLLLLTSCGEKSAEVSADAQQGVLQGQIKSYAGIYEGLLPCSDCNGVKTILEIKRDSSFIIREYRLTPGVKSDQVSYAGKINFSGEKPIFELAGRADNETKWFALQPDGNLLVTAPGGVALPDSVAPRSLIRTTTMVQNLGNVDVYEYSQPFSKYPARVFHRIKNGDMTIDRNYIAQAPEAEKALIAYYTIAYNVGCVDETCIVKDALNGKAEELAKKYFQSDYTIKPVLEGTNQEKRKDLEMLVIYNSPGRYRVQTSSFGENGKLTNVVEEYILNGESLVRNKTEEQENKGTRTVEGIRSRSAGPTSEAERQKIIDEKKKKAETPKK